MNAFQVTLTPMHSNTRCLDPDLAHGHCHRTRSPHRPVQTAVLSPKQACYAPTPACLVSPVGLESALPLLPSSSHPGWGPAPTGVRTGRCPSRGCVSLLRGHGVQENRASDHRRGSQYGPTATSATPKDDTVLHSEVVQPACWDLALGSVIS